MKKLKSYPRVQVTPQGKSLTEQSHKKGTDINHLVKIYAKTGQIPIAKTEAQYGEAPAVTYHEALNIINQANQNYYDLPPEIRNNFDSPNEFTEFVHNPENKQKMQELGILAQNEEAVEPVNSETVPKSEAPAGETKDTQTTV